MERNIKLLSLFNFFTDFKLFSGILIIYFARITGSYTLALSLFSITAVSSAIFEIPTGLYSDLIGRKKTIMLGAVSATISVMLYAMGHTYWPLLIGAIMEGLARAWYSGNNDALLYDSVSQSSSQESFAHHLGKTSSMFQLALMIGAVVGGVLAQWSFSLIMWLSVIPQIICLIISFSLVDPKIFTKGKANIFSHLKISAFNLWNNKRLKLLSIQDIIQFGLVESSFNFNAAFIGTVWPLWAIGFSKMLSFAGAFISFWFSGKIIRRLGEYNILIFANIYGRIIGFIAYGFPTIVSPVLMATSSLWYGANQVSKNSLMQKEYTHKERATMNSMSSFFGSLFYGIFAPIIGIFADIYGPAKALVMVQFCMLSILYMNIKLKQMK